MGEFVRAKALQKVGCMAVYNQDWCAVWVNSIKSEEMCLKVHREIGYFQQTCHRSILFQVESNPRLASW